MAAVWVPITGNTLALPHPKYLDSKASCKIEWTTTYDLMLSVDVNVDNTSTALTDNSVLQDSIRMQSQMKYATIVINYIITTCINIWYNKHRHSWFFQMEVFWDTSNFSPCFTALFCSQGFCYAFSRWHATIENILPRS